MTIIKLDDIRARDANREWAVNDACDDRRYLLSLVDEQQLLLRELEKALHWLRDGGYGRAQSVILAHVNAALAKLDDSGGAK